MDTLQQWAMAVFGPNVDPKTAFLAFMSPIFLLTFFIEWRVMKRRGRGSQFVWREILANVSLGAAYQVAEGIVAVLFTAAIRPRRLRLSARRPSGMPRKV